MQEASEPVGGPGRIVQIDESLFGKRKYNKGKPRKCQQWVFGGVEADTNSCFLQTVKCRDAATLIPIIKEFIRPGSTIHSDCWKAYDRLGENGYTHLTVNHSVTFVEGDVHTNKIEGLWKHAKDRVPKTHRKQSMMDGYLAEFCYRRLRSGETCLFRAFLADAAKLYKPAQ